jgi:hypothetical protein
MQKTLILYIADFFSRKLNRIYELIKSNKIYAYIYFWKFIAKYRLKRANVIIFSLIFFYEFKIWKKHLISLFKYRFENIITWSF